MKILLAGWFSFEKMGATAGDLIARDVVADWLQQAGIAFDIALAPPFSGGVDWQQTDPFEYTDVIFICGPFGNGWPVTEFLKHFSNARHTGLNLSMLEPLEAWNPFDILYERDSSAGSNPDLSLLGPPPAIPVVGLVLAHKQKEYGSRALHDFVEAEIQKFIGSREMAIVPIDTCLDQNAGGLRTPGEVEALIARMDLVITTRLHGTVLALKNGVPAIPIDPIAGGAKITRQVRTLGWPFLLQADRLDGSALQAAFNFCLRAEARSTARQCTARAKEQLRQIGHGLIRQLTAQTVNL